MKENVISKVNSIKDWKFFQSIQIDESTHTWFVLSEKDNSQVYAKLIAQIRPDNNVMFEITSFEYEKCFKEQIKHFILYVENEMNSYALRELFTIGETLFSIKFLKKDAEKSLILKYLFPNTQISNEEEFTYKYKFM